MLGLWLSGMDGLRAADGWEGQILSLTWENDAVAQTDRHYTQGARVAWWSRDEQVPGFLKALSKHLPALGMEVEAQKWGLAVSQEIYTPEDLHRSDLILEDRPYAGWLYASLGLQRRGPATFGWLTRETLRLDLGVVGPESLAEETQKTWHGVPPQGWSHQLRTEIGVVLRYDRQYRLALRSATQHWGIDFIPHFGGGVGNIATYLALGPHFRLGYNIPNEFAAAKAGSPPPRFGAYFFTGVDGRLVARNIFLDGNTFVHSHRVDKTWAVGEWKSGLTAVFKNLEMTASYTLLTQEFQFQKTVDSYCGATLTIKF